MVQFRRCLVHTMLTPRQMGRLKSRKTGAYLFDYVPFAMLGE